MKAEPHDKELDDLIHAAIGRNHVSFDFEKWKEGHVRSLQEFHLPGQFFTRGPAWSFSEYMSHHRRSTAGLMAAAAVLAVVLLLLLGGGQRTQTLRAIEQARTLHVVMKEHRNGQHFKDHEIWYDRQAGIMEREQYENRTDIRIDNGKYEWGYAEGGPYASRQRSYRDDNDELVRNLCAGWLSFTPRRAPSGDMKVSGVPCKMYVLEEEEGSCSLWADEQDRVRRVETTVKARPEEGEIRASMEIEYDAPIGPERFEPRFDPNVKVVDPRQLLEQEYPLDTALFTRESVGFTFAVHALERCPDGIKYLVCSIRLTEETRRQIDATHPWTYYGSVHLVEDYTGSYFDHVELLAETGHQGIRVEWYFLVPGEDRAAETAGCQVEVLVDTANELEKRREADGLPTRERFKLILSEDKVRQSQTSLTELADQVYSLGEQFDPIMHYFHLAEVLPEQNLQVSRRPGIQLSREQYIRNVQHRVDERLHRN